MIKVYGHFFGFERFLAAKNKAKQSQSRLAPSTAGGLKTNLKKQTQFTPKGVEWIQVNDLCRDMMVCRKEIWYKAYVTR
jgi:hypothetical protein